MHALLIGGGEKDTMLDSALNAVDSPSVLIIPSACSTERSYNTKVPNTIAMFARFQLAAKVLHGFGETPTATMIEEMFGDDNVFYTIGANLPRLLENLRLHKTDQALKSAAQSDDKLLAGTSSGALYVFNKMHSVPVPDHTVAGWDFKVLNGLDVVHAAAAVHANVQEPTKDITRLEDFRRRFEDTGLTYGFAIENNAALYITGDSASVLRSNPAAEVHLLHSSEDGIIAQTMESGFDMKALTI
jgi:peptidase E